MPLAFCTRNSQLISLPIALFRYYFPNTFFNGLKDASTKTRTYQYHSRLNNGAQYFAINKTIAATASFTQPMSHMSIFFIFSLYQLTIPIFKASLFVYIYPPVLL